MIHYWTQEAPLVFVMVGRCEGRCWVRKKYIGKPNSRSIIFQTVHNTKLSSLDSYRTRRSGYIKTKKIENLIWAIKYPII